MAKALGIGGVFFKSSDPERLAEWYRVWLGIKLNSTGRGACFYPSELPHQAYSVWSPVEDTTDYLAPSDSRFMINLVVDELDGALSQVVEGGADLVGEPEENEYGRFGWFVDPDGNKVELWQMR